LVLFVSDIHFGHDDDARERAKEAALVACLRAHEPDVEHLYLLGDVFDEYIEYRYLIPKGFIRFQALLAEWTDRGVPVTYLVGNHDPWHQDYFSRELGVDLRFDALTEPLYHHNVYMAHGDGLGAGDGLYRRLRPLLRHPVPVWLYRALLPGDSGFRLARWVQRTFGNDQVDEVTVEALRAYAFDILSQRSADIVVLGHTHRPEHIIRPEGQYLNTGAWHDARTFACLDERGPVLRHWNGTCSEIFDHSTA
jgi:UDP-2,3-diacylglucosamine hydrolase